MFSCFSLPYKDCSSIDVPSNNHKWYFRSFITNSNILIFNWLIFRFIPFIALYHQIFIINFLSFQQYGIVLIQNNMYLRFPCQPSYHKNLFIFIHYHTHTTVVYLHPDLTQINIQGISMLIWSYAFHHLLSHCSHEPYSCEHSIVEAYSLSKHTSTVLYNLKNKHLVHVPFTKHKSFSKFTHCQLIIRIKHQNHIYLSIYLLDLFVIHLISKRLWALSDY